LMINQMIEAFLRLVDYKYALIDCLDIFTQFSLSLAIKFTRTLLVRWVS
jgi:hypothetical protein